MATKIKETVFEHFTWIDISQPDRTNLDKLAQDYHLNFFQIKDSLEIGHLPKLEKQEKYNFIIIRAVAITKDEWITSINELSNKIAFFYNQEQIITIHRADFDFLGQVQKHYSSTTELLLYFIHKMVQTFINPIKLLEEQIDSLEKKIFLKDNSKVSLEELYFLKNETRITKKLLQISQNVINQLEVPEQNKTALQDIKDSLLSLILSYDEVLENANNLLNSYLSVNAQKNNEVMKLLTIFSAFFLPLTFMAGIYGMNFMYMPELAWKPGYFIILAVMGVVAFIIYLWFKRKKIL